MADLKDFGRWLASAIKAADLNQVGLAVKMGVSEASVSDWVHGKREPSEESIRRMARVLGVDRSEIYVALGRIPPDSPDDPPELRRILASLRNIPRDRLAELEPALMALLRLIEGEQTEDTSGTSEAASE